MVSHNSHRITLYRDPDNDREVIEKNMKLVGDKTRELIRFFCSMERRHSFTLFESDYLKLRNETLKAIMQTVSVDYEYFQTELDIIANVDAYLHTSSKRLIETVPMIFENAFSVALVEQLRTDFCSSLRLVGPSGFENCTRFVKEEPTTREQRQRLIRSSEILEESLKILRGSTPVSYIPFTKSDFPYRVLSYIRYPKLYPHILVSLSKGGMMTINQFLGHRF